ncbi:MAG: spermidine synthase [Microbacterium sp.]|nr:spermidine synthase [Microbacterium sp.]MBA4347034.1 spermidine synthase [Microbacterium sp.]
MGDLTLRRRYEPAVSADVFEVKLGEEYLMSSLFTVAEEALSELGLAAVASDRRELDVVVGGLGLGYTAIAALRDERVESMTVVDALPAVINWHERRLLPVSAALLDDARTRLLHADFFALMRGAPGESTLPLALDAILLDVDHSPTFTLDPSHADLYTVEGLRRLAQHLRPGGVFALWSDDPPEPAFLDTLGAVFARVDGHTIEFDNPVTSGTSRNGVYVAVLAA